MLAESMGCFFHSSLKSFVRKVILPKVYTVSLHSLKKNELIGLVGEQIRVDWLNDNTEINLQVQHTHIF